MRERILSYLKKAGKPLPATQILQDVLHIHSPNEIVAARVLKGIAGKDHRFRTVRELWTTPTTCPTDSGGLRKMAILYLESGAQPGHARGALSLVDGNSEWEFEIGETASRDGFRALREAGAKQDNRVLVAWSPKELRLWNRLRRYSGIEGRQDVSLCLRDLAALALNRPAQSLRPEDLAQELDLPAPDSNAPRRMAVFLSACFPLLLERIPARHRIDAEALQAWLEAGSPKVDFSRFGFGRELLDNMPRSPGVYIMRNRANDVVYIGKSRNLKRRVRSYFTPSALRDAKTKRIHKELHSIEVVATRSEVEALQMEMHLIRDFRPLINVQAEVHEQPGTYANDRNLLILVPREGENKAEVYFLRDGCFVAQLTLPLGRAPSKRIQRKIRSVYFSSQGTQGQNREPWEMKLVSRWLGANRKRLNFVDVDQAGSLDAVTGRLADYLKDPAKLRDKVYYR